MVRYKVLKVTKLRSVRFSYNEAYSFLTFRIAKISVTSPIVINMPTRELLAGETKSSFV